MIKDYILIDAKIENANNPRTFLVPGQSELAALTAGDIVKLIFLLKKQPTDGSRAERMWLKITAKKGKKFTGVLINKPCYIKSLKLGDTVSFGANNIASIHGRVSSINENMLALITRRAIKNRQVNWITKSEQKHDDNDSGWQFFYGDETQEYLDERANSTIVRLVEVLAFEPLIEKILGGAGSAYEYDETQNCFVETALEH